MKRCAFCGGRLGLVSHRKGSLRLRPHAEESNNRHLLGACSERSRDCAAESRDELPPPHSITSSAVASSI
jgi:hypothetical protein